MSYIRDDEVLVPVSQKVTEQSENMTNGRYRCCSSFQINTGHPKNQPSLAATDKRWRHENGYNDRGIRDPPLQVNE